MPEIGSSPEIQLAPEPTSQQPEATEAQRGLIARTTEFFNNHDTAILAGGLFTAFAAKYFTQGDAIDGSIFAGMAVVGTAAFERFKGQDRRLQAVLRRNKRQ
jgi:hypothetical protein